MLSSITVLLLIASAVAGCSNKNLPSKPVSTINNTVIAKTKDKISKRQVGVKVYHYEKGVLVEE